LQEIQRSLAHIECISKLEPIPDYDRVELATILGWRVVVRKNEFQVGDLCCYFEIDSKLPEKEWSEFLRPKHFKIKTQKMCKVISQGLALPIDVIPELQNKSFEIGTDVTGLLDVTYSVQEDNIRKSNKVDPEVKYKSMAQRHQKLFKKKPFRWLMRHTWGRKLLFFIFGRKKDKPKAFPSWIIKTDETRIENAPFYLESTDKWVKTEKLDGTSCTFAVDRKKKNKFEFIVCSRNVRQLDRNQVTYHESNIYWELADKYNIEKILKEFALDNNYNRIVLQGEGVGNVQGNPYKLAENDLYVFNLIIDGNRCGTVEMASFCDNYGLKHVPIIDVNYELPKTMEDMKLEADGYSEINSKVKREGFVYRSKDGKTSFKNVSREYLLKHNG